MRIGSLFSGAGGLDFAVQAVFGGEVVWHAEIDKAASKVLAHHWPDVPNLGDITAVSWEEVPPVDILCGGFPCQDVSAAGKRAGIKHGTRSGLWSVMADAIEALQPQIVVVENVRGLLSAAAHRMEPDETTLGNGSNGPVLRAAGAVLGDLADLGYDAQWATVAAADVGAPHRRERVFIVGVAAHAGHDAGRPKQWVEHAEQTCGAGESGHRASGREWRVNAHSSRYGWDERRPEPARLVGGFNAAVCGDGHGVDTPLLPTAGEWICSICKRIIANCRCPIPDDTPLLPTPVVNDMGDGKTPEQWDQWTADMKAKHRNGNGHGASLAIEVQRGDGHGVDTPLLPTPVVTDAVGARNSTAWRSNPDHNISIGDTLTDVMWKMAAGRGEMELPTGPTRGAGDGHGVDTPLLPTPCVVDRLATGDMTLDEWDESRRAQKEKGVGSFGPRGDSLGAAVMRVDQGVVDERPDYSTTKARGHGVDTPLLPTPTTQDGANNGGPSQFQRNTLPFNAEVTLLPTPNASDGSGGGQHPDKREGHSRQLIDYVLAPSQWGKYEPAIRRWEQVTGQPAPPPTEPNKNGNPRLSAAFSEWLMGWPAGWVTDPGIGISRNDQLRCVGNGVVTLQAVAALRYLLAVTA